MSHSLSGATRPYSLAEARLRLETKLKLYRLFASWGYQMVEVPALEHYQAQHPVADLAFKLTDGPDILTLRADFTPAIANFVSAQPQLQRPLRLQCSGRLWRTVAPDIARTKEFSEVGLELIGVSNAKADAEVVHLAREAVREVGLRPKVELGHAGFVNALFDLAKLSPPLRAHVGDAIDRKDVAMLEDFLKPLALSSSLRQALMLVPDLYGETEQLEEAKKHFPWASTQQELERLQAVIDEFEDASELLINLGMARRLTYYTGITFRAYTFDFGLPLLGGGRYDGALLDFAAGFALGLERLLDAMPHVPSESTSLVLALDDPAARGLRQHGYRVERALTSELAEAKRYAMSQAIPFVLYEGRLEQLAPAEVSLEYLQGLLES